MQLPQYQQFIATSRYARWIDSEGRRERWDESVDRLIGFWDEHIGTNFPRFEAKWQEEHRTRVRDGIVNLEVMPSMRSLMTAGPALKKDNAAGFNCCYRAINDIRAFDEIMYLLMCGCGVGFSVERRAVDSLPDIADTMVDVDSTIVVADSKLGWAGAFKSVIALLYSGQVPKIDYSRVRPAGSRLKTFGGRASGPESLRDLLEFCIRVFRGAVGRKLTSIECHDIVCKTAEVVVCGGVRRSALISLSDLTDDWMRSAKSGQWWIENNQRALANNSAIHKVVPTPGLFLKEWLALMESGSGERGIFSRVAAKKKFESIGRKWDDSYFIGANPCVEVWLRSGQMCNLTENVIRPNDTMDSLAQKIELTALLGTLQSTLTNFRYIGSQWKRNCEEEHLLGISLTGVYDNPIMYQIDGLAGRLDSLRNTAWTHHRKFADQLGVGHSTAATSLKPSGTVSQLVNSRSGLHAGHSPYYIRRVRCDKKDPVSELLIASGIPHEVDFYNKEAMVFAFPQKCPEGSPTRDDVTALQHLELWKTYRNHWTDHNPSVTITVQDHEWVEVAAWVYKHIDEVGGLSFLPKEKHTYRQAPYEAIDQQTYETLEANLPAIDWTRLHEFEKDDATVNTKELACVGGVCDLV